jgi:transcription-repair coupling factor (superfamily II helicase)
MGARVLKPATILDRFTAALDLPALRQADGLSLPALPGAAAAWTVLAMARLHPQATVLAITPGPLELEALNGDVLALASESGCHPLFFPALEGAGAAADVELAGARLAVLRVLAHPAPDAAAPHAVILTCIHALQQPVPDPAALAAASVHLIVAAHYEFDALVAQLVAAGYDRVSEVAAKGQLAVRGGLLDVWPLTLPLPVRAEFFDERLESLRTFDPGTQGSLEACPESWLPPCTTAQAQTSSLLDLLPHQALVIWLDHDRLRQFAETRALEFEDHLPWETLVRRLAARTPARQLFIGDPPPPHTPALPLEIAAVPGLADLGGELHHPDVVGGARQRLLADLAARGAAGETVLVCGDTAGTCEVLSRELGPNAPIEVRHMALSGGFVLPAARLVVVAQPDLYAVRKRSGRRYLPSAVASRGSRVEALGDLETGALVVHVDHGVGRYVGTTEIEIDDRRTEVFTLEYADGAKLHVPVSHAHLLSRYVGVGGHAAPLHHLSGKRWTNEKASAERAIVDLAASLLDTQARREVRPGFAFNTEPPWMHEFEAAFAYQETVDQERVIAEIKRDMAQPRPMDRLVCGDAGYGKTEVAMRAAFIAVMNGKQVAVLVPTTVLAEQHYETFRERLAAYPVQIEVLSRFRTWGQRQRVLSALATGQADLVIGTHALLQPGILFKDLGLLIVDEEQRFGVQHKEYLKHVRQLVDVLTLTATPIPRTLYMSMTGTRDMSLLQTPPQERLAIETRVVRDHDSVIRSAIRQELAREGQVFFLYNRVLTISLMHNRLARLVPEARIAVAHGQMPAAELAAIMRAFEAGEYDVLLCTTIVESGLDIPRANTIIIHRADRFGIADLYQLRGRVGRSSHKGFAWLLLPETGHVDDDARQRISALQKHSGLSAGFNLALRDLEIRGGGSLLGASQSGHIAAIGFGLYCQLLKRTVARLKGENPPLLVDVDLQLDFIDLSPGAPHPESSACLPYAYIEDEGQRMAIHRRIAEAGDLAAIRVLRTELADRFGRLPAPTVRLLKLAEVRILAAGQKLRRIETHDDRVHFYRGHERQPLTTGHRLPRLTGRTPDQKLAALIKLVATVQDA